jgi:hypothetical protein
MQPRIGIPIALGNSLLHTPVAGGNERTLCSAATHNIWTGLWQLGQEESARVDAGGP